MKKLLFILTAIIFMSCEDSAYEQDRKRGRAEAKHIVGDLEAPQQVHKFEYDGHEYILFRDQNWQAGQAVVHNPNCKCHDNYTE